DLPGPLQLGGNGHRGAFVGQLVPRLPAGFKGVLVATASSPFVALTLRSLTNSRGDFLLTTFPIADTTVSAPAPIVFPQIGAGGGYATQFILLSGGQPAAVTLAYFDDKGASFTPNK